MTDCLAKEKKKLSVVGVANAYHSASIILYVPSGTPRRALIRFERIRKLCFGRSLKQRNSFVYCPSMLWTCLFRQTQTLSRMSPQTASLITVCFFSLGASATKDGTRVWSISSIGNTPCHNSWSTYDLESCPSFFTKNMSVTIPLWTSIWNWLVVWRYRWWFQSLFPKSLPFS